MPRRQRARSADPSGQRVHRGYRHGVGAEQARASRRPGLAEREADTLRQAMRDGGRRCGGGRVRSGDAVSAPANSSMSTAPVSSMPTSSRALQRPARGRNSSGKDGGIDHASASRWPGPPPRRAALGTARAQALGERELQLCRAGQIGLVTSRISPRRALSRLGEMAEARQSDQLAGGGGYACRLRRC